MIYSDRHLIPVFGVVTVLTLVLGTTLCWETDDLGIRKDIYKIAVH